MNLYSLLASSATLRVQNEARVTTSLVVEDVRTHWSIVSWWQTEESNPVAFLQIVVAHVFLIARNFVRRKRQVPQRNTVLLSELLDVRLKRKRVAR